MSQLIEDLLGLSRMTLQPLRKTDINLGDMARKIFESLKSEARKELTVNGS
jgi:hypothetical protein